MSVVSPNQTKSYKLIGFCFFFLLNKVFIWHLHHQWLTSACYKLQMTAFHCFYIFPTSRENKIVKYLFLLLLFFSLYIKCIKIHANYKMHIDTLETHFIPFIEIAQILLIIIFWRKSPPSLAEMSCYNILLVWPL